MSLCFFRQFTIQHKNPNWKNNIYDIIELSQRIGNAWQLFGDLNLDPSSVTQEANISGVEMIEWKIIKSDYHHFSASFNLL